MERMTKPYRTGSLKEFADWTMEVVRDPAAARGVPKSWFDSKATATRPQRRSSRRPMSLKSDDLPSATAVVRLISDNMAVLVAIDRRSPGSIRELAELTGRSEPNVHRTLKKLEHAGIVTFREGPRRARRPVLRARKVKLEIDLRAPLRLLRARSGASGRG
jgi:predicted transcriptional regulator